MAESADIRYAMTGEYHIAYEVSGPGGGVDALRIGSFISNLEMLHRLPVIVKQTDRLASLGRLISFDHRGQGLSDRLRGPRLPSLEERMDDMRVVLDAAASERAVIVGFADGGPLCSLFAATHPERSIALVLCNTRPRIAWAPDYPWGMRLEEFERALTEMSRGWGTRALAEADARAIPWEGVAHEDLVQYHVEAMRQAAGPGDATTAFRMHYESDARHILPTIRVPTLVLSRGGDMAPEARAMADLIPGARHVVMPGTAPVVMAERPEAYAEEIKRFVNELREEEVELESVLATVLFTDIVGSTARQAALGDRRWQELVHSHHRVVRGCLARYRGRELDTAGDGFFAAFDGPARAIRCAQVIVDQVSALGIEVRAGLHTGECRTIDGKVGGLAVSIGARVTSLAGGSEILLSQTVKDLVAGSGLEFAERGEHELKGVPGTWKVYAVA